MADDRRTQGKAMRRKLMGDAYADKLDNGVYKHPIMEKFAAYTQEAIFGALWTRPGLDLKTRALICVISDAAQGRDPGTEAASSFRPQPRLDRGRTVRSPAASDWLRRRPTGARGAVDRHRNIQGDGRGPCVTSRARPPSSRTPHPASVWASQTPWPVPGPTWSLSTFAPGPSKPPASPRHSTEAPTSCRSYRSSASCAAAAERARPPPVPPPWATASTSPSPKCSRNRPPGFTAEALVTGAPAGVVT